MREDAAGSADGTLAAGTAAKKTLDKTGPAAGSRELKKPGTIAWSFTGRCRYITALRAGF